MGRGMFTAQPEAAGSAPIPALFLKGTPPARKPPCTSSLVLQTAAFPRQACSAMPPAICTARRAGEASATSGLFSKSTQPELKLCSTVSTEETESILIARSSATASAISTERHLAAGGGGLGWGFKLKKWGGLLFFLCFRGGQEAGVRDPRA